MLNKISIISSVAILLLVLPRLCYSQSFIMMTDEDVINLNLDMIRKGVQQQDTLKISMVSAPLLFVKSQGLEANVVAQKIQGIFDNSSKRKLTLKKTISNLPTQLVSSNFWDFDIVDPEIKIKGDSAFVDCELVLWGAPSIPKSKETGRKIKERFIFYSLSSTPSPPSTNEEGGSFGNKERMKINRSWQLVKFENLLDFLNLSVKNFETEKKE